MDWYVNNSAGVGCAVEMKASTNQVLVVSALSNSNEPHSQFITSDEMDAYYKLMTVPYESATAEAKSFWLWLMKVVMPFVSSEWKARKARNANQSAPGGNLNPFQEKITDYLSVSDFAYVPVVIQVYGKRGIEENEQPGKKRSRGRMKGQSGLTSIANISKYVQSFTSMKAIIEGQDNLANVLEWSDAAMKAIDNSRHAETNETVLEHILLAGEQAKRDIKMMKKKQILIPV